MTSTTLIHHLTYIMGAADAATAMVYMTRKDWTLMLVWLCYAVAAIALGRVR